MEIKKKGTAASFEGPAEYFTGSVFVDSFYQAAEPALTSAGHVNFTPGARTAWHTHPLGQMLLVTSGKGRVQRLGGPVEEIGPGDIVWFAPGEKHWHGAAPDSPMSHYAIQEQQNGSSVEWLEQVSDAQYLGK